MPDARIKIEIISKYFHDFYHHRTRRIPAQSVAHSRIGVGIAPQNLFNLYKLKIYIFDSLKSFHDQICMQKSWIHLTHLDLLEDHNLLNQNNNILTDNLTDKGR